MAVGRRLQYLWYRLLTGIQRQQAAPPRNYHHFSPENMNKYNQYIQIYTIYDDVCWKLTEN